MRVIVSMLTAAFVMVCAVRAQADVCRAIIRAAVESTALECADVEIGEVCYGSARLEVETADDTAFTRPGDVISVSALRSLRTRALDLEAGEWGVAVMRAQANAPEQNLLYAVFGDVMLTNTATETEPVVTVPIRVTFDAGVNVRAEPREDGTLTGALTAGAIVPGTGRLADGSWFRVFLNDGSSGWVRADLIRVEGELSALPVVTADDPAPTSLYSPMLVFGFESSLDDSQCSAQPESGILVQTADDAGEMRLIVNGVDVRLEGTAYLQARAEGGVMVTALEGQVYVTSAGFETIVPTGFRVEVRWSAEQLALSAPRDPLQVEFVRLQALPLILLPRSIGDLLEFNQLGIVTPAAPSPLEGVVAGTPCVVAAANNEGRMRTGPGRDYPVRGGLLTDESASPEARAVDAAGDTWWMLAEGMWVRSDIVLAAGECSALPLIEIPGN
jgi:uncharacterized protein YraI